MRRASRPTPKADALLYLSEARKLADKPALDLVERVLLRSFLEMAEQSVQEIQELRRALAKPAQP